MYYITILFIILLSFYIKLLPKKKKIYYKKINIPRRSCYHSLNPFYEIGTLYNKHENINLKLFGRERYKYMWDYYIIYNDNTGLTSRVDIPEINNILYDNDDVYIKMFDKTYILYKLNYNNI
jgi:hypothetical protein